MNDEYEKQQRYAGCGDAMVAMSFRHVPLPQNLSFAEKCLALKHHAQPCVDVRAGAVAPSDCPGFATCNPFTSNWKSSGIVE